MITCSKIVFLIDVSFHTLECFRHVFFIVFLSYRFYCLFLLFFYYVMRAFERQLTYFLTYFCFLLTFVFVIPSFFVVWHFRP